MHTFSEKCVLTSCRNAKDRNDEKYLQSPLQSLLMMKRELVHITSCKNINPSYGFFLLIGFIGHLLMAVSLCVSVRVQKCLNFFLVIII